MVAGLKITKDSPPKTSKSPSKALIKRLTKNNRCKFFCMITALAKVAKFNSIKDLFLYYLRADRFFVPGVIFYGYHTYALNCQLQKGKKEAV